MMNAILEAKAVNKVFPIKKMFKKTLNLKALSDIQSNVKKEETLYGFTQTSYLEKIFTWGSARYL